VTGDGTLIKKKLKIFLIFEEFQKGAIAKSYIANGLLSVKANWFCCLKSLEA
jgi:hypothetical protein